MKRKRLNRKIRAAGTAAAVMVITAVFIPGCGKKATPENLLQDMARNVEAAESFVYNLKMSAQMESGGAEIGMEADMDVETVKKAETSHLTGNMSLSVMGMNVGTDLEIYTVPVEEGYTVYTGIGDYWVKSVSESAEGALEADTFSDIREQASVFELSGELTDVNGQECYELTGDIGGDALTDLLDDDLLSSVSGLSIDEEDIAGAEIPCTLEIYRESILPARLWIDMKDLAGSLAGAAGGTGAEDLEISEYYMEITFLEYDSIREITVPEEALNAPEADGDDSLFGIAGQEEEEVFAQPDGQNGTDDTDETDGLEPASQLGELGTHWDSYTVKINDKVLTLPCTIADLEEAGLSVDTDYLPEDSMITDFGAAWFTDENGNEILADLLPAGEEAQSVSECLIVGLTVSEFDTMQGGIDILFPGGIRTGSSAEDVVAAYGEADDVYEGEVIDIYSWYEEGSYYNGCSVDVDVESGQITEIRLGRYE